MRSFLDPDKFSYYKLVKKIKTGTWNINAYNLDQEISLPFVDGWFGWSSMPFPSYYFWRAAPNEYELR